MAEKLEVRITGREIVKPSVQTPPHLYRFNLSLLDQFTDDTFFPACWFYSGGCNGNNQFPEKCRKLKSSLAETLSVYYPMAGRIRDSSGVDCCDDGVEFVEAEINCPMSRILDSCDPDVLKVLVPVDPGPVMTWKRETESLCLIQATLFKCGGTAVTVCVTHKLADAATFGAFVKAWGRMATRSGPVEPLPSMGLAEIIPPLPEAVKSSKVNNLVSVGGGAVTRRFLFPITKIEELKARASSSVVRRPSRVEAMIALVWKCAVTASRSAKGLSSTPPRSAATVAINLRRRLPVVSENTIGNCIVAAFATTEMRDGDDTDAHLSDFVIAMRKAVEFINNRLDLIPADEANRAATAEIISPLSFEIGAGEVMRKMGSDCFYILTSSVCGLLPISLDLGWGNSVRATPILSISNMVILMDTVDMNGVEASVTLGAQEMEFFVKDKHLLSFAAPAVSIDQKSKL